jgi:hypothetical protein
MKSTSGRASETVRVRRSRPRGTRSSSPSSSKVSIVRVRRRFRPGERRSAGVPVRNAAARSGAAADSEANAGRQRLNSSSLSRRNGRWAGSSRVAVSSAGGPPEMVAFSGSLTDSQAWKEVSSAAHMEACMPATGAASAAACSSAGKNSSNWVRSEAMLRMAGSSWRISESSPAKARFSDSPRPANAVPYSARFVRDPTRVGSSKVLKKSSISTGRSGEVRSTGIVAFSA